MQNIWQHLLAPRTRGAESIMSVLIYSARAFFLPQHCEMDVLKEQCICITFCWKLGNMATETDEMLQQALGETDI
jgi:hypothetical protein